jgi:hypothetical protein
MCPEWTFFEMRAQQATTHGAKTGNARSQIASRLAVNVKARERGFARVKLAGFIG